MTINTIPTKCESKAVSRHTRITQGQMNSLKLQAVNALFTVFDREIEARDARDADLARKLYSNREKLRTVMLELRRAEATFLKSHQPVSVAEQVLTDAAKEMKGLLKLMQTLNTVDSGAAQAITLLRNLPPQLK